MSETESLSGGSDTSEIETSICSPTESDADDEYFVDENVSTDEESMCESNQNAQESKIGSLEDFLETQNKIVVFSSGCNNNSRVCEYPLFATTPFSSTKDNMSSKTPRPKTRSTSTDDTALQVNAPAYKIEKHVRSLKRDRHSFFQPRNKKEAQDMLRFLQEDLQIATDRCSEISRIYGERRALGIREELESSRVREEINVQEAASLDSFLLHEKSDAVVDIEEIRSLIRSVQKTDPEEPAITVISPQTRPQSAPVQPAKKASQDASSAQEPPESSKPEGWRELKFLSAVASMTLGRLGWKTVLDATEDYDEVIAPVNQERVQTLEKLQSEDEPGNSYSENPDFQEDDPTLTQFIQTSEKDGKEVKKHVCSYCEQVKAFLAGKMQSHLKQEHAFLKDKLGKVRLAKKPLHLCYLLNKLELSIGAVCPYGEQIVQLQKSGDKFALKNLIEHEELCHGPEIPEPERSNCTSTTRL